MISKNNYLKKVSFFILLILILSLISVSSYALVSLDQIQSTISTVGGSSNAEDVTKSEDWIPSRSELISLNSHLEKSSIFRYSTFSDLSPNTFFVVDSDSWMNVFQMSTMATWDSSLFSFSCANSFSGDGLAGLKGQDRCAYPFFVTQDGDIESFLSFINQYSKYKSVDKSNPQIVVDKSVFDSIQKQLVGDSSYSDYISSSYDSDIDFSKIPSSEKKNKLYQEKLDRFAKKFFADLTSNEFSIDSSSTINFKPQFSILDLTSYSYLHDVFIPIWGNGFFDDSENRLVIISSEDYLTGLYASYLSSSLNAPLLFINKDSKVISELKSDSVLLFGSDALSLVSSLSSSNNRVFSLDVAIGSPSFLSDLERLSAIKPVSTSNAFVLFNSDDYSNCVLSDSFSDEFAVPYMSSSFTKSTSKATFDYDKRRKIFCRDSLLVPYLGIARQEILREVHPDSALLSSKTSGSSVDSFFMKSSTLDLTSESFDGKKSSSEEISSVVNSYVTDKTYLTLLGSPLFLPFSRLPNLNSKEISSSSYIASFLNPYFENTFLVDSDKLVLGWIFGLTPVDSSALIARGLFIDNLAADFTSKPKVTVVSSSESGSLKDNFAFRLRSKNSFANQYDPSVISLAPSSFIDYSKFPDVVSVGTNIPFESPEFIFDEDVLFDGEDSKLTPVVKFLANHPEITEISIEGHTDCRGSDSYNQGLSERRAKKIESLLNSRFSDSGIEVSILSSGKGESQPVKIDSSVKSLPLFKSSKGSFFDSCSSSIDGGCEISGCIDLLPPSLREPAHRLNRRVEIIVSKVDPSLSNKFIYSSSRFEVEATPKFVDLASSNIFYYFSNSQNDLFNNLDNSFYRGISLPLAPVFILDSPSSSEFSTYLDFDSSKSISNFNFPLALRFIRSGAKAVMGLNGKTTVANQQYFFPDTLLSQDGFLMGDFQNNYFDFYVKNTNPYFSLSSSLEDKNFLSCIPSTPVSVAHKLSLIGDPLSLLVDSSRSHSIVDSHPQIVYVDQPNVFSFEEDNLTSAYSYLKDKSILDYTSISRTVPLSTLDADSSFDVYVLSEFEPSKVTARLYSKSKFYSSSKVEGYTFVPDFESSKLSKTDISSDSCSLVSKSSYPALNGLSFSDGDLYVCSFSSKVILSELESELNSKEIFKQNAPPFVDVFLEFSVPFGADSSFSRYATSSFRYYLPSVFYNDYTDIISYDSDFFLTNGSVDFSIDLEKINSFEKTSANLYNEYSCTSISSKTYSCTIPVRANLNIFIGGPFLSSCQIKLNLSKDLPLSSTVLPSRTGQLYSTQVFPSIIDFKHDFSSYFNSSLFSKVLDPEDIYSSLASAFVTLSFDKARFECPSTLPLSSCVLMASDLNSRSLVPNGYVVSSDTGNIRNSFCSISPDVTLSSSTSIDELDDVPLGRFYVPLVELLGPNKLRNLTYAPDRIPFDFIS